MNLHSAILNPICYKKATPTVKQEDSEQDESLRAHNRASGSGEDDGPGTGSTTSASGPSPSPVAIRTAWELDGAST